MLSQILNTSNYYFNPHSVPVMLVGILIFSIGIFVLTQSRRSIVNIAFFFQCFSVSIWVSSMAIVYMAKTPEIALLWYRYITFFGVVNIMPSLIFLAIAWVGEFHQKKIYILANYFISLIFYILALTTDYVVRSNTMRRYFWGLYPIYGPLAAVFLGLYGVQFAIGLKNLTFAYQKETTSLRKKQVKTIVIASAIGTLASIDFIPKFFNIALYPYGYIPIFVYVSIVAYSIVRYRLMDIKTAITRTGIFIVVYTLILGIPLALSIFGKEFFVSNFGQNWWLGPFVLLILFATVGPYAYIYLQRRAEMILMRRQRAYQDTLKQAARELSRIHNLKRLLSLIVHIVTKTVGITHAEIYLFDNNSKQFVVKVVRNIKIRILLRTLDSENMLVKWLRTHRDPLVYEEVRLKSHDPAFKKLEEQMLSFNAALILPGMLKDELLGFLVLGAKRSGEFYTAQDLDTLSVIAHQATLAVENALLYENMEDQIRQRTQELVTVQKQLIQAEKLATVGTLAGGVAHEINNPLTAILTNAQMLLSSDTITDKLDKESLELIEEATKRCRTIVQKMMTYARKPLETAKTSNINVLDVLKKVTDFIGYQLEQDNIKIRIEANGSSYVALGNSNEFEQVFTNLILNARDAIKSVKRSGAIFVKFSDSGKSIKASIEDEGSGIPAEIRSKIFDPFFTTKDVGKGVGLGLAICQSIVEKHNGSISFESEMGKGTIFTISLPKAS